MIVVRDIEQGSPEWFEARLGIPTASEFSNIITPEGKSSGSASAYMNKLLAEWVTGKTDQGFLSEWMKRGRELEAEARHLYEFLHDPVEQVGIVYRDESRLASCSPDGLRADRGLEIKCPAAHTHISYLLANKLPSIYVPQIQGSMFVTGLKRWDFVSHHPDMEPLIIHVERDDQYIALLAEQLHRFTQRMLEKRKILQTYRRQAA